MSKKANLQANGAAAVTIEGFNLSIHADRVSVNGNGNIAVSARDNRHQENRKHDHVKQDRNRQREAKAQQAQAKQQEAHRQQNEAVLHALEQVSKQLASIAHHNF